MAEITSFAERVRSSLRGTLLDAAAELLAQHGFGGLRMIDVATTAGVSRQTVYNEFGSKAALVEAVALRTVTEFTNGAQRVWRSAPDLPSAVHAAVEYTVRHGRENRLVASVIGGAEAEDLLPLLTTRAENVLRPGIEQFARNLLERMPSLSGDTALVIAEAAVRLTVSHMMRPSGDPAQAAAMVTAVILPAIEHYS